MAIATGEQEPLAATMQARDEAGPMPLIQERLTVVIDDQHATTTLKQTYHNRARRVVEGQYALRAGRGMKVEGFAYWNGEQKIVGEVFEKAAAREVYNRVTRVRRDPGLLEETDDGAFTFRVFPIAQDEKKRIEISYSKWLSRQGRSVRYRAPVSSSGADIVVDIRSARPVKSVRSTSHKVTVDKLRGGGVRVRARGTGKAGTFELAYELAQNNWTVNAYVHKDPKHDGYFAVALAAPTGLAGKVADKDVTIVLDRSGSMAGQPLAQAKAAAADIIRRLGKKDRVNVIAFDDDVDPLFDEPQIASAKIRSRAIDYVGNIMSGGGTDIALALKSSLAAQSESKRPEVILFLTDGQSDATAALEAAKADKRDVRIFAVGMGDGVNRALLSRLSRIKRGQVAYIDDIEQIERNIGVVYRQISRPLLVDVSLEVKGAASGRRVYPRTFPDLFLDDELFFSGRLRGEPGIVSFTIRGQLDGKRVSYTRKVKLPSSVERSWVGRQWAQARVDHLLEDLALDGSQAEKKNEVIELALAYNFVTKFTSFLAIPENEATGAAKQALENAREQKRRALVKHADAKALKQRNRSQMAPPQVASRGASDELEADMGGDGDGDGDDADDEDSEPTTDYHPGSARKKSGCAGCATSSEDGGLMFIALIALVGLARTRRRHSGKRTA